MLKTKFFSILLFIVAVHFYALPAIAQTGDLSGHWKVDCGVEYSVEMNANFICGICDDFRTKEHELKQFHVNFINDSLYFPDNYKIKNKGFNYKWNPNSKILEFTYNGLERTFKVIKAGDSFILVSQGGASVILLLRRE